MLLDRLFERDGRTLGELEAECDMTRFGVMKHLRVLEDAGLVVTRRSGREKLHYLNPVPIREIHDRWIDKFTERHVSALADLMLQACIDEVWHDLRGRHREAPRFAVIGYGKLGGKELGYASDLDIIFLYDDDDERAPEVYARLAQRLNTWVSSRTSSGILFETDLELRPSGASGLLVSSIAAFERYQSIYSNIFPQMLRRVDWAGEVMKTVEADRRGKIPKEKLVERQVWRDRRLMALAAHKTKSDEEFGK